MKIERQSNVIEQWSQSGKSIAAWAQAHRMVKLLMGRLTYEKRWLQSLGQVQTQPHLTNTAADAARGATTKA